MRKFLIYLSIITVVFFAGMDAKEIFEKNDNVAVKTNTQVEMMKDILRPTRTDARDSLNPPKQDKERSNLFNDRMKQQQNNNIPQYKQREPLN